jgi:chemotaxis protein MotB
VRRRTQTHLNTDRWVLSYADFVTLMFAFFVAMYAISQQDRNSANRVSESVRDAVRSGGVPSAIRSSMATRDKIRAPSTIEPTLLASPMDPSLVGPFRELKQVLASDIEAGKIGLHLGSRGLVITLQEQSFFPSGDDSIYKSSYPAIARISDVIGHLPNPIQLEGHTDSVPIQTERFRNNWELSTARSIALLQLFQSRFGLEPGRFVVAGYGQNAPVASNDSPTGRALNRRVEIVILSALDSPARPR